MASPQHSILSNIWVLAHLLDVEWHLCVVFICIAPTTSEIDPKCCPALTGDIPRPFCLLCISLPVSLPLTILRWVLLIHWDNIQNRMIISLIPNISLCLSIHCTLGECIQWFIILNLKANKQASKQKSLCWSHYPSYVSPNFSILQNNSSENCLDSLFSLPLPLSFTLVPSLELILSVFPKVLHVLRAFLIWPISIFWT